MHVQQNFFEEYTLLNLKEILDGHVQVEKVVLFSGKRKICDIYFLSCLISFTIRISVGFSGHFCVCGFFSCLDRYKFICNIEKIMSFCPL